MVQEDFFLNGKKYISSKRVAEKTGYNNDYIGQLCRENKIKSKMIGRNRFVEENSLNHFFEKRDILIETSKYPSFMKILVLSMVAILFILGGYFISDTTLVQGFYKNTSPFLSDNYKNYSDFIKESSIYLTKGEINYFKSIFDTSFNTVDSFKDSLGFVGNNLKNSGDFIEMYSEKSLANISNFLSSGNERIQKELEVVAGSLYKFIYSSSENLSNTATNIFEGSVGNLVNDFKKFSKKSSADISTSINSGNESIKESIENTAIGFYKFLSFILENSKNTFVSIGKKLTFSDRKNEVRFENKVVIKDNFKDQNNKVKEINKKIVKESPTTIIQEITNNPIREVVRETIVEKTVSGISLSDLQKLNNELRSEIYRVAENASAQNTNVYRAVSLSNNIDKLTGVIITNSPISGSSFSGTSGSFSGSLSVGGTASFSSSTTFNGIEYLFPSSDGSANQVLSTDGAGGLSWAAAGSGSSLWTDSGASTYLTSLSDNIGIGTTSPYAKLSVVGQTVSEYFTATSTSATSTFPYLIATQSNVGTVVGGTWKGNTIGVAYGGTGLTSYTAGDVIYASGTGTLSGTSTPNLKTTLALNLVENTALSTWIGTSNLTTTGALNSGSITSGFGLINNGASAITTTGIGTFGSIVNTGSATSTYSGGISANLLSITSATASSTFANGINLTSGCFAINGTCITGSGGSSTFAALTDTQSSFTANRIIHTNSGGTALTDTSTFVFDGTHLGIGTTTPQALLHIGTASTSQITDLSNSLFVSGELEVDGNAYLGAMKFSSNSGAISWIDMSVTSSASIGTVESYSAQIDGTSILTVYSESDGAGGIQNSRVGIGTTSPYAKLSVAGDGVFAGLLTISSITATSTTATSTFAGGLTVDTNSLIVDYSTNRVGIGTSSPLTKLTVQATAGSPAFNIASSTGASIFYIDEYDAVTIGSAAAGNITFETTTITNPVLVGIGTTTPDADVSIVSNQVNANTYLFTIATSTSGSDVIDRRFVVDSDGDIFYDGAATTPADYAEAFGVIGQKTDYEPGDILALSTSTPGKVEKSNNPNQSSLVGVYSTNPGIIGTLADDITDYNIDESEDIPVGLLGRVPVKVSLDGGEINAGDKITSSFIAGIGMKATTSGMIIGTALESYTVTSSDNKILVLLDIKYNYLDSQFKIKNNGDIGIGTTSPEYKLHVIGDIAATSFVNISTRDVKKDISHLNEEDNIDILSKINGMSIARYRYIVENENDPIRLGLIAEESPVDILSASGKGVDIYKLSTFILAGVKAQQIKINELELRITDLESKIDGQTGGFSIDNVLGYLNNLGVKITANVASFKNLVVDTITIGSKDNPTGITLYDKIGGDPYCLEIVGGNMIHSPGECTTISESNDSNQIPPTIILQGTTTAQVEINSTYSDLGVIARDSNDNDLTVKVSVSSVFTSGSEVIQENIKISEINLDTSTSTTYVITYSATDQAGNTTTVDRTVIVGGGSSVSATSDSSEPEIIEEPVDTIVPIINLEGESNIEVELNGVYLDEGATASDEIDGDITENIITDGEVDITTIGTYTITYNVSDSAGNQADEVIRTVIVVEVLDEVIEE